MAEVKWIKLRTDMFDDEKIQLIDALPERDTILYIWVRLLTMAGKVNDDGNIYLSETIPYTDEMLSTIFKRPLNTVRMAMSVLEDMKMITMSEDQVIRITNWEKHQNVNELEKIKEQNRIRQKRHYERKKVETEPNVILTLANGTDKIRLDKNREDTTEEESDRMDYKKVTELYHEHCPNLPKIREMTSARKKTIKAWGSIEEITEVFIKAGKSDFLNGDNDRKWKADFDWVIKPTNRVKILEGKYTKNEEPTRRYKVLE